MKQYWWSNYGSFTPDETENYPDPASVLDFYLQNIPRGQQRITQLGNILKVKRALAYRVLKKGTDSIGYSRKLVAALSIPPQLLKLDASYAPIQDHPLWWQQQGIFCPADNEGYPEIGAVIAFLRKNQTKRGVDNTLISWRQQDLAAALGLTKETVIKMEKQKNERALDSISRRKLLALALGGGATTFALLGLHATPSSTTQAPHLPLSLPNGKIGSDLLASYEAQQSLLYNKYFQTHGEETIGEALEWILILKQQVLPHAVKSQQVSIFELISRYHQHVLDVAREQRNDKLVKIHSLRAIEASEKSSAVSTTTEEKLRSNELLAASLLRVAEAYFEQGYLDQAKKHITRALALLPLVRSYHLHSQILLDTGMIFMHDARNERERILASYYFENAHTILDTRIDDGDKNFIRSDNGIALIRTSMAQIVIKAPGSIFQTLDMAKKHTPLELKRRHVILLVYKSQALINSGEYDEATVVALEALQPSQQIHSRLNRDRIQNLYQQLSTTTYQGDPMLVRLGMQLQLWR